MAPRMSPAGDARGNDQNARMRAMKMATIAIEDAPSATYPTLVPSSLPVACESLRMAPASADSGKVALA